MSNQYIVYNHPADGVAAIVFPSPNSDIHEVFAKDVPPGVDAEIINADAVPARDIFRNSWVKGKGRVDVDLGKAKVQAHELRRRKRQQEFAPHDDLISKQIPGYETAEPARVKIRDKYKKIQADIDAAQDVDHLYAVVDSFL